MMGVINFILLCTLGLFLIYKYSRPKSYYSPSNKITPKPKEHEQDMKSIIDGFIIQCCNANEPNSLPPIEFHVNGLPYDFKDLEYTVIDFETANRSPLSAISMGIAHFKGNLLLDVKEFKFSPIITFPWEFEHIHKISMEDAKNNPKFEAQWEEIVKHLDNKLLVAHNADFDMEVLKDTVSFIKKKLSNMRVACTYKLAKRFMRYERSYSLENLCKDNNIPYWNHKAAHDAVSAGILFMKVLSQGTIPSVVESAMRGRKISIKY